MADGIAGIAGGGPCQQLAGLLKVSAGLGQHAQVVEGARMVRRAGDDLTVEALGFRQVAGSMLTERRVEDVYRHVLIAALRCGTTGRPEYAHLPSTTRPRPSVKLVQFANAACRVSPAGAGRYHHPAPEGCRGQVAGNRLMSASGTTFLDDCTTKVDSNQDDR